MLKKIPVLNIDSFPGHELEFLGCVSGCCCLSKSLVQDVSSNVKNWTVGGELTRYSQMIEEAVELARSRVQENAEKMGADAVVGFRLATTAVSAGAAELIAYGTAVKFVRNQ